MNNEQKQRAMQILRRFEQADPMTRQADNAAVDMAALLRELIEQPTSVPVLTVECEPGHWSGGHYHEGTLPHIDPTTVWKLPIGTELYTSPPANNQSEHHLEMVRDAERYRWLKCERFDKPYAVTNENMTAVYEGDELDSVIDAAIAAEKGGA